MLAPMVIRNEKPLPPDFETMAVDSADQIRRFVLREAHEALDGMPEAQKQIQFLTWKSRKKTDFEIEQQVIETLTDSGRALTFGQLQKRTYTPKGRLILRLQALESKRKVVAFGSHRAKRYRLPT
ncbi:MAG TPA: hypothetical protein VNG33_06070 [Polyangiaceae bacterium]|nr:hypothetical protein [Polyangiaceae bacterium]